MNAGRELDALTAEKVMGWKLYKCINPSHVYEPYLWCSPEDTRVPNDHWPRHRVLDPHETVADTVTKIIPHYSTDIAAAWQVVEKMLKIGQVNVGYHKLADPSWACRIFGLEGDLTDIEVYAPTAPLAICLAALKAIGDMK
jgi:hypothetical protein